MCIARSAASLAHTFKDAGAQWHREYKLWSLPYAQATQFALFDRLTDPAIE
jgi:hypothetical protein